MDNSGRWITPVQVSACAAPVSPGAARTGFGDRIQDESLVFKCRARGSLHVAPRLPAGKAGGAILPRLRGFGILPPLGHCPRGPSRAGCGPFAARGGAGWAGLGVAASWGCAVAAASSFVVPRGGLPPLAAAPWRRVVGSALFAGARRWRLRRSARSFSGVVVVAGFSSPAAASAFAGSWSGWCGFPVVVRRFAGPAGPLFGVSVPVAPVRCAAGVPVALPRAVAWAVGG